MSQSVHIYNVYISIYIYIEIHIYIYIYIGGVSRSCASGHDKALQAGCCQATSAAGAPRPPTRDPLEETWLRHGGNKGRGGGSGGCAG